MSTPVLSGPRPMPPLTAEEQSRVMMPHSLLQFETHVVEHCDLNCQMCTHFSPLAQPEYADLEAFSQDMHQLGSLFSGKAAYIMLLGGEPLLHPELPQFFDVTRAAFPFANIILYTNGLRLTKVGESFWRSSKENRIHFILTRYPIPTDYTPAEKTMSDWGIPYEFCNTPGRPKRSSHFPLDLTGGQNPQHSFSQCSMANRCIFLRDGKLYPCCLVPNIRHFNQFFHQNLLELENDGINIYDMVDKDEILRRLATPIPFCRYCDVDRRTIEHTWHVSKRMMSEWT